MTMTWHRITRTDWYADGIDSHDASDCADLAGCKGEVVKPGSSRFDMRESWMKRERELREATPETRAQALKALSDESAALETRTRAQVVDARLAGLSWSAIGDALGMTRQGAQQRYGARL